MARWVDSEEAARRLGIKRSTLYVYVSRGLLSSHAAGRGRHSLFDLDEIEQLTNRSRVGRTLDSRLATVVTSITQLRDDGPRYRGRPVADLAAALSYEAVADLLWQAQPGDWVPQNVSVPSELPCRDALRAAAVLIGARDPLRHERQPEIVTRSARLLIASMVNALPQSAARPESLARTIAADLSCRLGTSRVSTGFVRAIDAALVVLADHELASSTVGVRLAASTRADLYDAVLAGLGVLGGPLHGGDSDLVQDLLGEAALRGADAALDDALRLGGRIPGFGHAVYAAGDPRFAMLRGHVDTLASPRRRGVIDALVASAAARGLAPPNVDFGLGALTWATGAARDAGQTIFTIGRLAGWVAHYLEEIGERPLRFRLRAVYVT